MKDFYIEVTEKLSRIVCVKAEDIEEAYDKIEAWANSEEGLTYEDFVDRDFKDVTDFCESRGPATKDAYYTLDEKYTPVNLNKYLTGGKAIEIRDDSRLHIYATGHDYDAIGIILNKTDQILCIQFRNGLQFDFGDIYINPKSSIAINADPMGRALLSTLIQLKYDAIYMQKED